MGQVLVNPNSGLAETFDPDIAQQKLQAGYHVPLHDPTGKEFSAPMDEAVRLIHEQGYSQPNPDQLNTWVTKGKFGTGAQQALTFIEGATKGLAGPLSPYVENRVFRVPYEDIEARKNINPGAHMAGEATGTGAGLLVPGLAEASLPGIIAKAGKAAEAGIAAEGVFGTLAKKAVQGSIEGSLYEINNKIHEGVLGNPKAVSEYALADIGMAAALGGGLNAAFGASAPFMKKLANEGTAGLAKVVNKIADADTPEKKSALDWMTNTATLAGIGHMVGGPVGGAVGSAVGGVKAGMKGLRYVAKNHRDQLLDGLMNLNTAVAKGVDAIDKHAGSLFGFGASEAPKMEHNTDLHELHDPVRDYQLDTTGLINHLSEGTSAINDVAPEVSSSISGSVQNAINYLESKRPSAEKKAPLDEEPELSQHQISNFNHVAQIVDNPLKIFGHIKDGTLSPQHMEALQTVYPALHRQMQTSIMGKMTDYLSKNESSSLPYNLKVSLSKFMGQPLDSSLTVGSLLSNQRALTATNVQNQMKSAGGNHFSKSGAGKIKPDGSLTRYQRSSSRR